MFKKTKFFVVALLCLLLVLNLTACSNQGKQNSNTNESIKDKKTDEPIVLRLAENQPENNPVTIAMYKFAELVEEKTDGKVKIDVYPNAQLGQETETIEQVQLGVLDLARVNSVPIAQIVDEMKVFTLPYMYKDLSHKYKVWDGEIGQEILEKLKEQDIIGLGYLEAGSRNFYTTKKPIKSVADLKGQKIRVQESEVMIKMVKLLGAVATPMNYGEVYTSLQTGVIDGAENDFVSYYTSGHYEVAKHYTLDEHLAPPALIIMSRKVWDELPAEYQKAIKEAADEAKEFERKAMVENNEECRKKVEEAGCTIYEVDINEFQDAVEPLYNDYPELSEVINAIREID
ncbi:MAG: TRAP transporter substrate-binding protein [Clostridiales bacterium]|uniref:TRAP transporter substrate-binding protein n=1 Tax=Tepidanaerobacter sp. EBM-38 TaxID=1918496 RepID=UPI000A9BEA23|nr:TRAP transporter substrate-binding protein [Tepidanaerobacter sp. EBM-38]NLH02523.1 TRAP transporter substrate-binding protein [Clostridiales bacterium]